MGLTLLSAVSLVLAVVCLHTAVHCSPHFKTFGRQLSPSLYSTSAPIPANYSVKWYSQKVDHFNYVKPDRYQQRYVISMDNWCDGCPIFFYAGNEGDVFAFVNNTGFMWENAPQFKAMVLFAEHRYYGQSFPYGKLDRNLTDIGYLTTEQALADFAELLQYIKETIPGAAKSPVFVFGGSYGGMLATWFRIKYPHLSVGALAGSAPILQFPGIYECNDYFNIVTNDFKQYSANCSQTIRNSWPAIRRVAQSEDGLQWLTKTFVLCKQLTSDNLEALIGWLADTYVNLAMVDYPNPASFLAPLPAYPIRETCKHLTDPTKSDKQLVQDIYGAVSVFYNYTGQSQCNDIFNESEDIGSDAWGFQACTEMVLPVCSNGVTDMFEKNPWNFDAYSQSCDRTYGVPADKEKAIVLFGGRNITTASNIIFSNGDRDPWSAGGVLKTLSPTLIAIHIPHACHHEDLRSTGPNDPPALKEARDQEIKIIRQWINDYYKQINYFPKEWTISNSNE